MSYGLNPYAVDVDALVAKHGCDDRNFLRKVEREFAAPLERDEQQLARERERNPWRPSLRDALRRFVAGDTRHSSYGERLWYGPYYGYTMEMLCRILGRPLYNSEFEDIRSSFLDKIEVMTTLLKSPPPLPLTDPRDFPFVHHLTANQVLQENKRLASWNGWSADRVVLSAQEQYREWIADATATGQGIVAFYR